MGETTEPIKPNNYQTRLEGCKQDIEQGQQERVRLMLNDLDALLYDRENDRPANDLASRYVGWSDQDIRDFIAEVKVMMGTQEEVEE